MKKLKIVTIILISLILILIGAIFIIRLLHDSNSNNNSAVNNSSKKTEISNYVVFELAEYETIENVVFYNKNININETLKNNLTIIANELKTKYPNKSILYLRNLGSDSILDVKGLYRCMQIVNGQKLDNTDMNVLIKEDGSVKIQFLMGSAWKRGSDISSIKVTQEQAEQITIDYLVENPSAYSELRSGFFSKNNEKCTVELYKYNFKTSWKMQFSTGNSYIIIDANTGEILDKYFFCGVYVD